MTGDYSILLQDVRSAFADFTKEKSPHYLIDLSTQLDILEKNILHFISVYRKSEVDFLHELSTLLEGH